jgi:acetyl esterase/lipase
VILTRRLAIVGAMALGGCASLDGGEASTETFDIWPDGVPGGEGVTATEEIIERSKDPARPDRAVIHVRRPTLKVFRPARPDGSAVLVIPGGGYQRVVLDKEGDETARFLARSGVTAAVLVYRLPGDGWRDGIGAPLQDAQRAMRMLRSQPGINAKRAGALGFSAGGHLAASLALQSTDAAERPDFAALIYAAYLRGNLPGGLGGGRDLVGAVSRGTQPMFLLHAADDATVPVEGSLDMQAALKAAGVPAELHVFPEGGHGFGIAGAAGKPVAVWPELLLAWGRARGMFG